MDRRRIVRRLYSRQYVQVVLVAVQCQWLLLGHGIRYRSCPDLPIYIRRSASIIQLATAIFNIRHRIHRRYLYSETNGYADPEKILYQRQALGILEARTGIGSAGKSRI